MTEKMRLEILYLTKEDNNMQTFREFVDELNKHIPLKESKRKQSNNKYKDTEKDVDNGKQSAI